MVYIDGLNLRYGILGLGFEKYMWLDLAAFGHALLSEGQQLVAVNYFTARFKKDRVAGDKKQDNQSAFLTANRRSGKVVIHESFFIEQRCDCANCSSVGPDHETSVYVEKLTDTHIASRMIGDAVRDRYDIAILVSRDNDLAPPVREVLDLFPEKQVIVASPTEKVGKLLRKAATHTFIIKEQAFANSQLPDTVTARRGVLLTRPEEWTQ